MKRVFWLWLLALVACGEARAQDPVRVELADLPCSSDGDVFESARLPGDMDETCAWIPFRDRTTYEVAHSLGRVPRIVIVYLSFSEDGRGGTVASGDIARIDSVTADQVVLTNATNEEFFMRVALQ